MDQTLHKALYIILTSAVIAFIFNFLFFGKEIGISFFIFVVVFLGAIFLLGRKQQLPLKQSWWLILLILFFALMPGIRANPILSFLNGCATLGLLLLLAHQLAGTPAWLMKLRDYLVLLVVVPLRMLYGALSTLSMLGKIHTDNEQRDIWLRVLKGIVMAVPILLVFAVLFAQADLAFKQFVNGFVHITISPHTAQYTVLLCLAFVAALSSLSYIFLPKTVLPSLFPQQSSDAVPPKREVEMLVFLGLIAALFLVFIIFQVTYLFGGQANIAHAGFTYAEYARRGFWELLVVAFLSLLVLFAAEKYAGAESKIHKQFLVPALILIAEVGVVMFSAFKRLSLYIDAYGMTYLRFYVVGFVILVAGLFVILAIKFIRSRPEQFFMFGTLLSVAGFLIVVNVVNPDAFIVHANVARYQRTGKFDVTYLRELTADAEAQKIDMFNQLQGEDKEYLRTLLQTEKTSLQKQSVHWQSTNWSRAKALQLLNELSNM